MSTIKLSSITNKTKTAGPTIDATTSSTATGYARLASGTNEERVSIESGSIRYNETAKLLEFYDGTQWNFIIPAEESANALGVFSDGYGGVTDYITISTTGDAQNFGNLTLVNRGGRGPCSSSTRGIFGGGYGPTNVIDYITFSQKGNGTDFGDLIASIGKWNMGSCSSTTRGVFGGGFSGSWPAPIINSIDYITIATTGNALDFGDLTGVRQSLGACSSSTRGVFGGGVTQRAPTQLRTNTIDYITIASQGSNASTFGTLSEIKWNYSACSSSTRGVFGGGLTSPIIIDTIDYITIATTGDALYFGDLTQALYSNSACSSSIRGVFGAGLLSTSAYDGNNIIDYVTIATTGNAIDFGDLVVKKWNNAACSNNHGGLL